MNIGDTVYWRGENWPHQRHVTVEEGRVVSFDENVVVVWYRGGELPKPLFLEISSVFLDYALEKPAKQT